jgi:hypothetical protein
VWHLLDPSKGCRQRCSAVPLSIDIDHECFARMLSMHNACMLGTYTSLAKCSHGTWDMPNGKRQKGSLLHGRRYGCKGCVFASMMLKCTTAAVQTASAHSMHPSKHEECVLSCVIPERSPASGQTLAGIQYITCSRNPPS